MEPTFQRPGPLKLDATNLEEEWKFFVQKFNLYMLASGAAEKPEKTRLAMFLNFAGDEALKVYNTFTYTTDGDESKLDIVQQKFNEYCTPRKNVVHERFLFWKLTQQIGESIDTFVTTLRLRAASCEFGIQTESMIRDRVVLGCPDRQVQERLLREADLTLQKALDVCRAAEATKQQIKSISADSAAINLVRGQTHAHDSKQQSTTPCDRKCGNCGGTHPPKSCPAFGKLCNTCHKPNHWAKCCRSAKSKFNPQSAQRHRSKSRTRQSLHSVGEVQQSIDSTLHISSCSTDTDSCWWKMFNINGININCKLDSGAEANIMSADTFGLLKHKPKMRMSNTVLSSYTNDKLKPFGTVLLRLRHRGKSYLTEFYIVDSSSATLIGLPTCQTLDVLRRIDVVHHSSTAENIIHEYADVFSGIGCYPGEHHIVLDTSVKPVIHAPRRVPLSLQPKLKQKLDSLVEAGVLIEQNEPTDWVNSLLTVEKKDGSLRLCLDPKDLNKAIKREHYAIPTVDDITAQLHGKTVFTIIDMKDAFWQIKLSEQSSKLCTFNTPFGRYSFRRLPFGISSAPEVFQKWNENAFGDIPDVYVVFDDLIIAVNNDQEHDATLRRVLDRARELNIRFSKNKIQLKVDQVKYLGHILSADGIRPDPDKIKAIVDLKQPVDKKELLRFLGMLTYLSKFIPNFSDATAPLRALLRTDIPWTWSEQHVTAFSHLKQLVVTAPVLRYFDSSKPAVIQTDSSSSGIGSCLLQDGQPVAYASRALTDAETRYAQIEKELLAVVFATEKFSQYIYGRLTTIHSDHKPLESIFRKAIGATTPRLQRMLLRLLKFQLHIEYVPGKSMHLADTLSRAYLTTPLTEVEQEINDDIDVIVHTVVHNTTISDRMMNIFRDATQRDPTLSHLCQLLQQDEPVDKSKLIGELYVYNKIIPEIYEVDGILFHNHKVIVPTELRWDMVKRIHEGHLGMDKCKALGRSTLYWPGMSRDIEHVVSRCTICNAHRRQQQHETLLPHPVPEYPWQKVGCDIFTLYGKDYLLIVDYYSKFPEVCHLQNKTASHVIVKLKSVFARYGICEELIADNMPFGSAAMKKFAEDWNFVITTTSPNYPQSNGQSERAIQTVKGLLRKAEESGADPNIALLQYRNSPIAGSTFSPAQLSMNRQLRTRIPVSSKLLCTQPVIEGRKQLCNRQLKQKQWHDRSAKDLHPLNSGDVVRIRHNHQWQRGVVSSEHSTPRSYIVQTEHGAMLRRNRRDLIHTTEDLPPISSPLCDDNLSATETSSSQSLPTLSQSLLESESGLQPSTSHLEANSDTSDTTSSSTSTRKSGRTVRRPVRFADYVT